MQRTFILPLILYFFVIGAPFGSEASDELETLRAGNVFEPIDLSSFPKMTTAKECYQLCTSLIQSEIKFWTDSQKSMLEDNKRLAIIVSILAPKEISQPARAGTLVTLPKIRKAIVGLDVREKLFINPLDPTDTTNKDLYDLYKSYSAIIKDLTSVFEHYMTCKEVMESSKSENDCYLIKKLREDLLAQKKEIETTTLLYRGLLQTNTAGMKLSQICREQKGKFQGEIGKGFAKYAFCDVEYVTEIFVPTICEILQNTYTQITQIEVEKKLKIAQAKKQRNKMARKVKKKILSTQEGMSTQPSLPSVLMLTADAPKSGEGALAVVLSPSLGEQIHNDATQDSQIDECIKTETTDVGAFESVVSESVVPMYSATQGLALDNIDTSATVFEAHDTPYDPRPWEQYTAKKTISKEATILSALLPTQALTSFQLNMEYSLTARCLLGLAMSSQEKVEMCAYEKLVIKGLSGAVLNRKKTMYFMARSLVTQQWYSVAMHRLHQDDSHIIPRDTRYWKIARQLLLDIELEEGNLYPLL